MTMLPTGVDLGVGTGIGVRGTGVATDRGVGRGRGVGVRVGVGVPGGSAIIIRNGEDVIVNPADSPGYARWMEYESVIGFRVEVSVSV